MSEPFEVTSAAQLAAALTGEPMPRKPVKHPDPKRSKKTKRDSKVKRQAVAVKSGAVAVGVRVKRPKVNGTHIPSTMMRVSLDFANFARSEAVKHGVAVTEATRAITEMLK